MNEVEMEHRITAVEKLAGSNKHRIDELDADTSALRQLATSVEVLATKQEAIETSITEIKADVKSLKAVPASRWEGLIKAVVTAIVAGLVGWALAQIGIH